MSREHEVRDAEADLKLKRPDLLETGVLEDGRSVINHYVHTGQLTEEGQPHAHEQAPYAQSRPKQFCQCSFLMGQGVLDFGHLDAEPTRDRRLWPECQMPGRLDLSLASQRGLSGTKNSIRTKNATAGIISAPNIPRHTSETNSQCQGTPVPLKCRSDSLRENPSSDQFEK